MSSDMELTGLDVALCEDVINCILYYFDDKQSPDRATLLACSLVSRDWAYPSQVRILKTVVIHGPDLFCVHIRSTHSIGRCQGRHP